MGAGVAGQYSIDNGATWISAGTTNWSGVWTATVLLPSAGTTTFLIRAKRGNYTSDPADFHPVATITVGAVDAARLTVTGPDANGKVDISGFVAPGGDLGTRTVQYRFNGTGAWQTADSSINATTGAWEKTGIQLPATGATTINFRVIIDGSQIFSSETSTQPITFTVPAPTITDCTDPDAKGDVILSGTRPANYEVWYKIDAGGTWTQLVSSGASTTWTNRTVRLPSSGEHTIYIATKKNGFYSETASVTVVHGIETPTVNQKNLTATGKVTLYGTTMPNTTVWYSFNGVDWISADTTTSSGEWEKQVTLPAPAPPRSISRRQGRSGAGRIQAGSHH